MNTDREWEKWGKVDPYFGVLTHHKFRKKNFTQEAKTEFFESGRSHIRYVLEVCRQNFESDFSPKRALDFGCGTGRLVIPLAEIAEHVVGIEVVESMLSEARKNCEEYRVKNVSLLKSTDDLSSLEGRFDFIHSSIVFQHIPIGRGRHIFMNLLNHLEEGGICAVHFTCAKARYKISYGVEPMTRRYRGWLKAFFRRLKRSLIMRGSKSDPEMQMNPYNLNELLFIIQIERDYQLLCRIHRPWRGIWSLLIFSEAQKGITSLLMDLSDLYLGFNSALLL